MEFHEILSFAASVTASLMTIAAGVFALMRWIIPAIKAANETLSELAQIRHEFHPNGGDSMRDQIDKLLKQGQDTYAAHKNLADQVSILANSVEAIASRQWALVATQPAPVFETNDKGECVRANVSYLNLVERDFEQVRGFGWELCIHPDDKPMVVREWLEAVNKDRPFELTYKVRGAVSGRVYEVQCIANPYYDHDGKVLGYLGRFVSMSPLAA